MIAAAVVAAGARPSPTSAFAQAKEQFFPLLSYCTGPMPGMVRHGPTASKTTSDDQRPRRRHQRCEADFEECETGYATDRGVECYERLKSRPGVTLFDPQATGITFALTEKAPWTRSR